MENTSYLYDTLVRVLSQHANWLDLRHLKTLAWMMVGLINSYSISLGVWTPFVLGRAQYSQKSCSAIKDEVGYPQTTMEGAHRWVCKSETIAR